jgi:uncharacterized membrane protein (UPF0127 family)
MRASVALALVAASASAACPPPEILEVETSSGVAAFHVEIVDTPETRARGLMFRTDLAREQGMLFLFPESAPRTFWMKNTPLSLDMLFMGPAGVVCGLIERATPHSLDPRPSGCDASAVLEINGGLSREMGISVGARVRSVTFGDAAAWPCDVARPPAKG